jgi:mono/diheme cytochrome c family protein
MAGALVLCSTAIAHDLVSTKVTWTREISRIFQARCVQCHAAGGRSTIPLSTYEQARPWAAAIREEVLSRRMPIWHAARGYGEFANDPSLSPFEIALIAAWVDGGSPKGTDPAGAGGTGTPSAAPKAERPGPSTRVVSLGCGVQPLSGELLAVNPRLSAGGAAGIAALLPDGRREVVAWIRDYDPAFPTTYWLRRPIRLPSGSRLSIDASGDCAVTVTLR